MKSLLFFIIFVSVNVAMYINDLLTMPMIITTILASIWFMILIYVQLVLSKKEELSKVKYKRDFSLKTFIYIALFILLVIRMFIYYEGYELLHVCIYLVGDNVNDYGLANYYIISDDKKYNKIILIINKFSKNFSNISNRCLFALIYMLIYYVINVVIF